MGRRFFRWAFRLLGPRYPLVVLSMQYLAAHFVVLGGVALLLLYQDMSGSEFLLLVAAAETLMTFENAVNVARAYRVTRPVSAWIDGDRTRESTVEAWRIVARLPTEHFRRWRFFPILFNALPFCVFTVALLELPLYSLGILFAGGLVVVLYGWTLRYFTMEFSMRPVLEAISAELPGGVPLDRAGLPLRLKLLLGLPAINIITGVIVAGLSTGGSAELTDLGIDVIIAVGVAFTLSLELTLLLSRSILLPIQDLREAAARVGAGDLDARVPVVSTDETGALAQSFNVMVDGLQERERLREAFGAFVDPEVAERVLREGTVLDGEEVEVTVLFLDIRDFTAFAEQASAHEVVAQLNEFYEVVVPVLLRHGGHANKFVGDGLLGVFGAPDRMPDHADRAVAAALDIAACVRRRYGDRLRIGIGVNSGPVVAGTIGGGGRVEFTVIGDAVNTAARVEEVTRGTEDDVLVTEATRCLLTRESVSFQERPAAELKGKVERVRVYAPRPPEDVPSPDGQPAVRSTIGSS